MEKMRERFNWELMVSVLLIVGSIVGTTVPLYIHSSNQMESMRQSTEAILREGQQEMRDFHGRLERIDAEFKNGMLLIEEKIKK